MIGEADAVDGNGRICRRAFNRTNETAIPINEGNAMKCFFAIVLLCAVGWIVGCDGNAPPMKPGGGGLPQPYSPGTGQYIPSK